MKNKNVEMHLFILWENALFKKDYIINKIKENFLIIDIQSISWSKDSFSSNLSRFYGEKLLSGSKKEKHCGVGPFLSILIYDYNPVYEYRSTSKGTKLVNINTFDAKQEFRNITGGGHKVHSTNSILESKHDVMLLFGKPYEVIFNNNKNKIWKNKILKRDNNIIGYNGWESFEQFFRTLNETIDYVILRNFKDLKNSDDIDVLTTNLKEFIYISNAKKIITYRFMNRVQYKVKIDKIEYYIDIRSIGDNYYDGKWQKDIISNKVLNRQGFYIPSDVHYKYSLLYHYIAHKKIFFPHYFLQLSGLFNNLKLNSLVRDLKKFMNENKYCFVSPRDLSIKINHSYIPISNSMKLYYLLRKIDMLKNNIYNNLKSLVWYAINYRSFKKLLELNENIESLNVHNIKKWHDGSFHFTGFNTKYNSKVFIKTDFTLNLLNNEFKAFEILYNDKRMPFKIPKIINNNQSDNFNIIQYEYIHDAINLNQFFKKNLKNRELLRNIIKKLVRGIKIINQKGLIHRDINPNNILFKKNNSEIYDIYLIDFSFMIEINNKRFKELNIPESSKFLKYLGGRNKPSNFKWDDIYSLYCIAYKFLGTESDEIVNWKNLINKYTYSY